MKNNQDVKRKAITPTNELMGTIKTTRLVRRGPNAVGGLGLHFPFDIMDLPSFCEQSREDIADTLAALLEGVV